MDKILYKLDTFEGPLDFSLMLIKKTKFRIYALRMLKITVHYLGALTGLEKPIFMMTTNFLVRPSNLLYIKPKV